MRDNSYKDSQEGVLTQIWQRQSSKGPKQRWTAAKISEYNPGRARVTGRWKSSECICRSKGWSCIWHWQRPLSVAPPNYCRLRPYYGPTPLCLRSRCEKALLSRRSALTAPRDFLPIADWFVLPRAHWSLIEFWRMLELVHFIFDFEVE